MKLNLSEVPDDTGYEVLPADKYLLVVERAEVKDTKAGNGQFVNMGFKIITGPYENRWLWHCFNIENPSAKAVEIGLSQLKSFLGACKLPVNEFDTEQADALVGQTCVADVSVSGTDNKIRFFESDKGQYNKNAKSEKVGGLPF